MDNLIDVFYVGGIVGFFLLVVAVATVCHNMNNELERK